MQPAPNEHLRSPAPMTLPSTGPNLASLTRREHDVLRWIAEGKSNRDVGELLGISLRTVEKHMENILKKLGADNRTAAVLTWVREHGPAARKS